MNQQLGTFQDSWNPRELMVRCGFECLLDCETILSFGPVPDGDPNDAAVRVARTVARRGGGAREETIIVVPQGMTKLVTLREGVRDELLRGSARGDGNWHWGDQFDVQNLSDVFDVGVLMFCENLQAAGQECLYNISSERENYAYWVSLWWREPTHFRLAELSFGPSGHAPDNALHSFDFTCFWSAATLPPLLREQYRRCNRLAN